MESKKFNIFSFLFRVILIILLIFVITDVTRIIYYQIKVNQCIPVISEAYDNKETNHALAKKIEKVLPGANVSIKEETKFNEYEVSYQVRYFTPFINNWIPEFKVSSKSVVSKVE